MIQSSLLRGGSATITCILMETQRQAEGWEGSPERKKGGFRCALLAWGSCRWAHCKWGILHDGFRWCSCCYTQRGDLGGLHQEGIQLRLKGGTDSERNPIMRGQHLQRCRHELACSASRNWGYPFVLLEIRIQSGE